VGFQDAVVAQNIWRQVGELLMNNFYCFALLLYNLHHYRVLSKGVIGG
jgi:hypothetical protein